MRKRFRGNAPISTSLENEGGGGGGGGGGSKSAPQLYGGKPAFDVVEGMSKESRGEVQGLGFDPSKTRGL